MDAVLWLEEYLSKWDRILFFVCHSQDFLNNVCTHIVRLDMTYKKLRYYSGNYDTYVQTRRDQDMVQTRQYEAEQKDIAEIKDFIARFGHGTAKMVKQAQSREKLLQKKLEAGLTSRPELDPTYDWSFPDAGQLPVPVLSIENVSFAYPGGKQLYSSVDFGVDLQTRVALVGPNGAGKVSKKGEMSLRIFWLSESSNALFSFLDNSYQTDDRRANPDAGTDQTKHASQDFSIHSAFRG